MIITVNESIIGELFFSLPEPEELTKAEEQISYICRSTLNDEESSRLEYELEQMKKTKTAFHFLILKEIYDFSKEHGHAIVLKGNSAGSIISYLLGISPINPNELPFISSELIWESHRKFYIPDFEINISADIRPLIQKRLDEKFGFIESDDNLFYNIRMTYDTFWDKISGAEINIKTFDLDMCTAVMQELFPAQKNVSCNFEQLINVYAYDSGAFINEISSEKLLSADVIVTRDQLYTALISNSVPKELAIEVVKKGVWSNKAKKEEYLLNLEKYSLPESVIYAFNNAKHLWDAVSCISRLCVICQSKYESVIEY